MNENKKWYESSTGTGNLALTVKGALLALVPVAIAVLSSQGINLAESDVVDFINSVFTALSAIALVLGLGRKVYYSLKK